MTTTTTYQGLQGSTGFPVTLTVTPQDGPKGLAAIDADAHEEAVPVHHTGVDSGTLKALGELDRLLEGTGHLMLQAEDARVDIWPKAALAVLGWSDGTRVIIALATLRAMAAAMGAEG
ncbi:MAG: hypothetical protein UHD09_07115 [Bifidobacterium sp.]|nr:hypothetical protein [Bifidobacterium sp.]